jgi:hypothetical protein
MMAGDSATPAENAAPKVSRFFKVSVGHRGVFHASQIGPLPARDEANQLCESRESLEGAGGSCFVQRN